MMASKSACARPDGAFPPASIPGLIEQTDFLRGVDPFVFVQFDNRDIPGTPRNLGACRGHYAARFVYYDDRDLKRHSHRRLDLDAQHYISFFNRKRVIALRAKTSSRTIMTFANGSAVVPFYMQPVLGGSDDLRGFRQWRFYDNNLIVATAEYRWEAFSGRSAAWIWPCSSMRARLLPGVRRSTSTTWKAQRGSVSGSMQLTASS